MNIRNARHLLYLLAATLCLSLAACASPKAGLVQEPSGLETRAMPGLEPDESYGTETSPAGFAETARVVVEGHLTVAVPDTATAANELRALVQELGGHVTQERLQPGRLISTVEVRLPPARVDELLEAAGELGSERDRSVIREDVS